MGLQSASIIGCGNVIGVSAGHHEPPFCLNFAFSDVSCVRGKGDSSFRRRKFPLNVRRKLTRVEPKGLADWPSFERLYVCPSPDPVPAFFALGSW